MEKVGHKFASNDAVVIAKMDATANDVLDKRFIVKAYPTLYFYQAKTGQGDSLRRRQKRNAPHWVRDEAFW